MLTNKIDFCRLLLGLKLTLVSVVEGYWQVEGFGGELGRSPSRVWLAWLFLNYLFCRIVLSSFGLPFLHDRLLNR